MSAGASSVPSFETLQQEISSLKKQLQTKREDLASAGTQLEMLNTQKSQLEQGLRDRGFDPNNLPAEISKIEASIETLSTSLRQGLDSLKQALGKIDSSVLSS